MKKFALVLIALGAIATAASASQRNEEYPLTGFVYSGGVSAQTVTSPLAVGGVSGNSAFAIQSGNSVTNSSSSHN